MMAVQNPSRHVPMGSFGKSTQTSSMGKPFGHKSSWNTGIWGNGSLSGGFGEGVRPIDITNNQSHETKTGSSSLLSTSEDDTWDSRPNLLWKTMTSSSDSMQNRNDPSAFGSNGSNNSSFFPVSRASTVSSSSAATTKSLLNPSSDAFFTPRPTQSATFGGLPSYTREEETRRQFATVSFGNSFQGNRILPGSDPEQLSPSEQSVSSRAGSIASRNGYETAQTQLRSNSTNQYAQFPHGSVGWSSQRPNHSTHSSFHSENQALEERFRQQSDDLSSFGRLSLGSEDSSIQSHAQRPSFSSHSSYDSGMMRPKLSIGSEEGSYQGWGSYNSPEVAPHATYQINTARTPSFLERGGVTDSIANEYRRAAMQNGIPLPAATQRPSSSQNGSAFRTNESALLERKFQIQLYQEQQNYLAGRQFQARVPFTQPQFDYQQLDALRMNPLAAYYAQNAYVAAPVPQAAIVQPSHARDNVANEVSRSPLLEEFRTNNKGNKRYELKDIYNHIVEFSGDQHGSRFIQQKLETANSDEKEQVFKEIATNSVQLMTDVFGNYVIQKMFEHGNQMQKKALANHMKGNILQLSTQMYACRVVQKALEHVLVDQQASMMKELESQVIKCVKDQNGNHVIQKAIERVPAEHIQFIVDAFTGEVRRLATHPYGCRVIQRMLEHCHESARLSILAEIHACSESLISDQFGNYVIQHVIENGESVDKRRVISIVVTKVVNFSKHKFASNVVEKSIEFGTQEDRDGIYEILTGLDENGESPLAGLMRDQYGNYVIQKLYAQITPARRSVLIEIIKPLLVEYKKVATYGKQVMALDKLIADHAASIKASGTITGIDTNGIAAGDMNAMTSEVQSPAQSTASFSTGTVESAAATTTASTKSVSSAASTVDFEPSNGFGMGLTTNFADVLKINIMEV